MKHKEKLQAQKRRRRGESIKDIARSLGVAKSSVSIWVRDVVLSDELKEVLNKKGLNKNVVEKRRQTRLKNEELKRYEIRKEAEQEIRTISKNDLLLVGAMLYWGEGAKTQRGRMHFTNSDPDMIRVIMRFYREVCGVSEEVFKGYIHLPHGLNVKESRRYWSEISGISENQFFNTHVYKKKGGASKKVTLPHGTLDVYVCDTRLFLRIQGWIKGIKEQIIA